MSGLKLKVTIGGYRVLEEALSDVSGGDALGTLVAVVVRVAARATVRSVLGRASSETEPNRLSAQVTERHDSAVSI